MSCVDATMIKPGMLLQYEDNIYFVISNTYYSNHLGVMRKIGVLVNSQFKTLYLYSSTMGYSKFEIISQINIEKQLKKI